MVHAVALASSSTSSGTFWAQLGTAVLPEIIDALDKSIREDMQRTSHSLFLGVLVSAFAVAIGVLLEGPEILHELWPRIFVRFTWSSNERLLAFERKIRKIAFIGWFLIGIGVVGEGIFEGLQNWAEGELQTFNDILLADAQRNAGNARESATDAAKAAEAADSESDKATLASTNALSLASGARAEADSYKQEITSATQQAADAVSRLADAERRLTNAVQGEAQAELELKNIRSPRSLTDTPKLVAALRQYKGTEYVLNTFADQESMNLTVEIGKVLKQADWVRKQPPGMNIGVPTMSMSFEGNVKEMVPSCVDTGVSINVHTKESLAELNSKPLQSGPMTVQAGMALRNALPAAIVPQADGNVAVGIIDPTPGEGPMTICVGKKPL